MVDLRPAVARSDGKRCGTLYSPPSKVISRRDGRLLHQIDQFRAAFNAVLIGLNGCSVK